MSFVLRKKNYLRKGEGDTHTEIEMARALPSSSSLSKGYNCFGWPSLNQGTRNFIWVSPVGNRGLLLLSQTISKELHGKQSTQVLNRCLYRLLASQTVTLPAMPQNVPGFSHKK